MKQLFLLLFSAVSFTSGFGSNAHKFYMSIADIHFNKDNRSLEISIKFFTDDIEKALEETNNGEKIFLGDAKELASTDLIFYNYLREHFQFHQAEASKPIDFIGKEVQLDYTWVYIEVKNIEASTSFTLTNTLLLHLFNDQTNQVNYNNDLIFKSQTFHKDFISSEF